MLAGAEIIGPHHRICIAAKYSVDIIDPPKIFPKSRIESDKTVDNLPSTLRGTMKNIGLK